MTQKELEEVKKIVLHIIDFYFKCLKPFKNRIQVTHTGKVWEAVEIKNATERIFKSIQTTEDLI